MGSAAAGPLPFLILTLLLVFSTGIGGALGQSAAPTVCFPDVPPQSDTKCAGVPLGQSKEGDFKECSLKCGRVKNALYYTYEPGPPAVPQEDPVTGEISPVASLGKCSCFSKCDTYTSAARIALNGKVCYFTRVTIDPEDYPENNLAPILCVPTKASTSKKCSIKTVESEDSFVIAQTPQVAGTLECLTLCGTREGAKYYTFEQDPPVVQEEPPVEVVGDENPETSNQGVCTCYTQCDEYEPPLATYTYNGKVTDCTSGDGDPHFVGARGTHFDFNGALGKSFCLFTDKRLHVNGFFDGFMRHRRIRSWIKDMAVAWKAEDGTTHEVQMSARRGKDDKRGEGFLTRLAIDGVEQSVPSKVGDEVTAPGGFRLALQSSGTIMKRGGGKLNSLERDTFSFDIPGLLSMELSLNADYEKLRGPDDAQVHFNFLIQKVQVTPDVHGVLGQTYQPGFSRSIRAAEFKILSQLTKKPIMADERSGSGFLDGSARDYVTSGLGNADCKFSKAWNTV